MTDNEKTLYFSDSITEHGYRVIRRITSDNYGNVYEVEAENGKHLAVKEIRLDLALQELDIMSRFRHPHLMEAFEVYRNNDNVYVVMPLADSSSNELLKISNRGVDICVRKRILYELISALDFLQKNGVIHCDIKTENIMLYETSDNYINAYSKLGDMGLIKYYDYDSSVCQTHESPEEIVKRKQYILYDSLRSAKTMDDTRMINKLPYDQVKVTMYALGITMIEILSGKQINNSTTRGVHTYVYYLMKNPGRLLRNIGIGEEWIPLLERLVNFNIDIRPSTFEEILRYPTFVEDSLNKPISGVVLFKNITPYCDQYVSEAVNIGMQDMVRLNADISVASLFIEILYRVYPYIIGATRDVQEDRKIGIPLLVSSIIYMSSKLIDQDLRQNISPDNLIKILDMVYLIYFELEGIIYVDTLYNMSHSFQMTRKLMRIATTDCNLYLSKPLREHIKNMELRETAYQRGSRKQINNKRDIKNYLE